MRDKVVGWRRGYRKGENGVWIYTEKNKHLESPWRQTTAAYTSNPYQKGYTEEKWHAMPFQKLGEEWRTNKTERLKSD